jgi:hypothetical protein
VVFKVSGVDTGGAFAVVEHPIEPGRLVPPHVHLHEDEYSYVLEGTIGARLGDHEVVAGPGSYLFKPRGLMHTFWNAGPASSTAVERTLVVDCCGAACCRIPNRHLARQDSELLRLVCDCTPLTRFLTHETCCFFLIVKDCEQAVYLSTGCL